MGIDGKPMMTKKGYAVVKRFFNTDGQVEKEVFLDTEEKPVESKFDGYGTLRSYDEKGRNNLIVHINENGEPIIAGNGYAIIHRSFYEEGVNSGRVKNEFYFDENNNPAILSLGQSGLHKEYDELGRACVLTYLDGYGNSINTRDGYTTIIRSFNNDDSVRTEMYYDQSGNPAKLSDGQYGVLKKNGQTIYLNAKGGILFSPRNYLNNNHVAVILITIILIILSTVSGKKINTVMLIIYVGFIAYMTLLRRKNANSGMEIKLLWSYKQFFSSQVLRWEIINNILLFIPLGAILYRLCNDHRIIYILVFISFSIEIIQYVAQKGVFELDDIFSNCIGGYMGARSVQILEDTVKKCTRGIWD